MPNVAKFIQNILNIFEYRFPLHNVQFFFHIPNTKEKRSLNVLSW